MPTVDCRCGVCFYSSEDGLCPRCRYGEFDATPDGVSGRGYIKSQYRTGPREELIGSVVHALGRVDGQEKLISIVYFVCKSLEARHIMPPFYFKAYGSRCMSKIKAALQNLDNDGIIEMVRRSPSGRVYYVARDRMQNVEYHSEADRIIKELVEELGNYSSAEIMDLLYLHFPMAKLNEEAKRTYNDINQLLPSHNVSIPWSAVRAPELEDDVGGMNQPYVQISEPGEGRME